MNPSGSSSAPTALDAVVPPGATAQEAFALMQQERINSLETDYADLAREMVAMRVIITPPVVQLPPPRAVVAAPQPPPPPPPPPPPVPAAAVVIDINLPLLGQPPENNAAWKFVAAAKDRCANAVAGVWTRWGSIMHREEFYGVLFTAVILLGVPGLAVMICACVDRANPNTHASALVTNVTRTFELDRFDVLCTTDVMYTLHGGAVYNNTLLIESTGSGCDMSRIGTLLGVCYRWSKPSEVDVGSCSYSHAAGMRETVAAAVLLGGLAIPAVPCLAYWALRAVGALWSCYLGSP